MARLRDTLVVGQLLACWGAARVLGIFGGRRAPEPAVSAGRRIRVVHCIGSLRTGGAERQLAELICRLPRDRFEQSVVLTQSEGLHGALVERVERAGCRVVALGGPRWERRPGSYFAMARAFWLTRRHLRAVRADVFHGQLFWANIVGGLAADAAGVPAIMTSRLQLSIYKQGRPLMQWIENFVNRLTDIVVVNSEAVRRDTLEVERLDAARTTCIYNGVVQEDYGRPDPASLRAEFGIGGDAIVVVAVANLHPYKGHEDLIRAFAELAPRHPRLRMLLPGRDSGARPRLEALIAELNLGERVHLPGERGDIPKFLALADIVVHPSHQEGFSNSILEAMCAAKPLVVTNVGGNPEAVRDGVNGFVVLPAAPVPMAEAIERLVVDPELRARMAAASRTRIETEFDVTRMVRDYADLYEKLLAER